jgi:hypothetical protein
MPMHARVLLLTLCVTLALAGCTEGVGKGNFELKPQSIGWFAGDEARFTLELTSTLLRDAPSFTIDRRFAIEEIQLTETGVTFGGDYETRDPDALDLRLAMANVTGDAFTLDAEHPALDLVVKLPEDLRDSEYRLEIKLFKVGWVKSESFRVDVR